MASAHGEARSCWRRPMSRTWPSLADRTRAAAAEFDRKVGDAVKRIENRARRGLAGHPRVAKASPRISRSSWPPHPAAETVVRAVDSAAGQETA